MKKNVECFGLDYYAALHRSEELWREGIIAEHFACCAGENCEEMHWRVVWDDSNA